MKSPAIVGTGTASEAFNIFKTLHYDCWKPLHRFYGNHEKLLNAFEKWLHERERNGDHIVFANVLWQFVKHCLIQEKVVELAKKHWGHPLEMRGRDSLDFSEMSACGMQALIYEAVCVGMAFNTGDHTG
jgi:hypothetical protein